MRTIHTSVWISLTALFAGAPLTAAPIPITGVIVVTAKSPLTTVEGTALSGTLGTFTDSDGTDLVTNYTATVNWGDTTTSAAIVSGSSGSYSVTGGHTYAEEGSYTFALSITDTDGGSATGTGTANVSDASLSNFSAPSFGFTPGVLLSNITLASFSDGNPGGLPSDFIATINWGDGTSTAGIVSGSPSNFSVSSSHTYAAGGTFTISDTILDDGGAELNLLSTANSVPEPASLGMILAGIGLLSILAWRRRLTV